MPSIESAKINYSLLTLLYLTMMVTSEPRALRIPASSTAMYPLPTTTVFLGGRGAEEKMDRNPQKESR